MQPSSLLSYRFELKQSTTYILRIQSKIDMIIVNSNQPLQRRVKVNNISHFNITKRRETVCLDHDKLALINFFLPYMPKKLQIWTPFTFISQNDPLSIFRGFIFCRFPHSRHLKWREWAPSLTHVQAWQVCRFDFIFFDFFFITAISNGGIEYFFFFSFFLATYVY